MKEAAEISMGTEISEEDIRNIKHLCEQVVEIQVKTTVWRILMMTTTQVLARNCSCQSDAVFYP